MDVGKIGAMNTVIPQRVAFGEGEESTKTETKSHKARNLTIAGLILAAGVTATIMMRKKAGVLSKSGLNETLTKTGLSDLGKLSVEERVFAEKISKDYSKAQHMTTVKNVATEVTSKEHAARELDVKKAFEAMDANGGKVFTREEVLASVK